MPAAEPSQPKQLAEPVRVGRYVLHEAIGTGGMASVHIGRLHGASGFAKTVAIKRLHPQYAADPEFASMFVDEARLAARVVHPNVVSTLDVVHSGTDLLLVMEYVDGDSLAEVLRGMANKIVRMPLDIASAIFCGVLSGLSAAHVAKGDDGHPLNIVHRDVSPENIIISVDGIARVLDFGIAKASGKVSITRDGTVKGKLAYMAPEQVLGGELSARTDLFAVGTVLYEVITGYRAFKAENDGATLRKLLYDAMTRPKSIVKDIPDALDDVIMKALAREGEHRFTSAAEMQAALEEAVPPATPRKVAEWMRGIVGDQISRRAQKVANVERGEGASSQPIRLDPASPSTAAMAMSEGSVHLPMQRPRIPLRPVAFGALAVLAVTGALATFSSSSATRTESARKETLVLRALAKAPEPQAAVDPSMTAGVNAVASASSTAPTTAVPKVASPAHAPAHPPTTAPKPRTTKLYGRD